MWFLSKIWCPGSGGRGPLVKNWRPGCNGTHPRFQMGIPYSPVLKVNQFSWHFAIICKIEKHVLFYFFFRFLCSFLFLLKTQISVLYVKLKKIKRFYFMAFVCFLYSFPFILIFIRNSSVFILLLLRPIQLQILINICKIENKKKRLYFMTFVRFIHSFRIFDNKKINVKFLYKSYTLCLKENWMENGYNT